MSTNDSKALLRQVKRVQFGILSPDEIVSTIHDNFHDLNRIIIKSMVFAHAYSAACL